MSIWIMKRDGALGHVRPRPFNRADNVDEMLEMVRGYADRVLEADGSTSRTFLLDNLDTDRAIWAHGDVQLFAFHSEF